MRMRSMKWMLGALLASLLAFAVAGGCELDNENKPQADVVDTSTAPTTATITITSTGIDPSVVTIQVGGEVTWQNDDSDAHYIDFNDGSMMDPEEIAPGGSKSVTFNVAGDFSWQDGYSTNDVNFMGTIRVQ